MLTLSDMIAEVRAIVDSDGSDLSDAIITSLLNEAGNWYYAEFTNRFRRIIGSSTQLEYQPESLRVDPDDPSPRVFWDEFLDVMPIACSKILQVYRADSSSDTEGIPLQRVTLPEMYRIRRAAQTSLDDPTSIPYGTPKYFTAYIKDKTCPEYTAVPYTNHSGAGGVSSGLPASGASGYWCVMIHPPVEELTYLIVDAELYWPDLDSGQTTYYPDVTGIDERAIIRIASEQAAHMLDRPDAYIESIRKLYPEHVRGRMGMNERELEPRPPRDHSA